ncbi:hypothetical protein DFJ73DRAFT_758152 [Zopfochytrium polystomum]|nr:hypothetical protein DFJ73DRAFT_758152 [Zopfochytrium polystomum]
MGKSGKPSKSKKSKKKSSSSHTRKRLRVNPPKAAQAEENGGRAAVGIPEASSVGTSSAASSTTASRDCSQSLSSSSEECSSSSDSDSNSDSSSGSGVASKSDRFKWTLDLESALVEAYNQLPNRTADNNLKKSEWTIVQSSFNKGSGQNASVKQLISKWNRITSDFDTLKKLRSSDGGSGWGWDDVKGMLVQPSKVVWEEWIKAGRNRRRFKKLKFPFYDTVDGLVGGSPLSTVNGDLQEPEQRVNTHQDVKTLPIPMLSPKHQAKAILLLASQMSRGDSSRSVCGRDQQLFERAT